ncbi:serine hydrolase domain-containing protein [Pedobacter immunditicola]|uniref:serine hydrolase domain-containing protein n=1 Tax=Pedobacter immunditicola TaxID=3133440 RepID=UPI0030AE8499
MKFKFFLFFIAAISYHLSYAQTKEGLKDTMKNLIAEQKLSGAVWATVSEKGEIVIDAHGFKNIKTRELLNATDKVHVGSVSKTIMAAGFLRMATLGLLDLNDPVKKYLPDLPMENQWDNANPVTIKHLIDHTSGLTNSRLWHIFSTTATPDTPLDAVFVNDPNILKVRAKPGSIYSYSNLGYTILGMVIEKITKDRYENYLDENLLKPLRMTNSTLKFISQAGNDADQQLAYGHFDDGSPVIAMPTYLRSAGQLTTTAEDMGIFLRFMMSDGTINGKPFIKSEYLAAVGKQKLTDAYKNGVPFGDALGAYSRDRYGVVGAAKNGTILGFSAMTYMFPDHRRAFFIAHNMDSETANYDLFNATLVKHLGMKTKKYTSKQQLLENEISNWNGYYIPVFTKIEPFGLLDHVFSHTKVETTKDGALVMPFQGTNRVLIYQGKHLFSMKDRTTISHTFYRTADGEFVITDGLKTMKKVHGLKILSIACSLFLGLVGLVYVFIAGCISLIKHKIDFRNQPIFWLFLSILILIFSFILIANQPFMQMGDVTIGNILLAVATTLIPVFSVVSLFLTVKMKHRSFHIFNFLAILFVFQFSVLLIMNDLMPIVMWK